MSPAMVNLCIGVLLVVGCVTAQPPAPTHPAGHTGNITGQSSSNTPKFPFDVASMIADKAYLLDVNLTDLYGIYFGEGDLIARGVVSAYGASRLPECHSGSNIASVTAASLASDPDTHPIAEFDWSHFGVQDPHHLGIIPVEGVPYRFGTGHLRQSSMRITDYSDNFLTMRQPTGAMTTQHLRPYVDMRSGQFMVESRRKQQWTLASNGTVVSSQLPVSEDEEAGCFTQGSGNNTSVTAVSIASYRCISGACLKLSPLWTPPKAEDGHSH